MSFISLMSIYRSCGNILTRLPSYVAGQTNYLGMGLQNVSLHTSVTDFAARKGTREKARLKKLKRHVEKVAEKSYVFPHLRFKSKMKVVRKNKHLDDDQKLVCPDNVFLTGEYRAIRYPAVEAIDCHKETHHPTMLNNPDALIYATIELNMLGNQPNKLLDGYTKTVIIPHGFPHDSPRTVLAFCKDPQEQSQALAAGATVAGGMELIRSIQKGTVSPTKFDYVIAHPNILTELIPVRGLMKRKFPNLMGGTVDYNIVALVKKFSSGIQFKVIKDNLQPDFAEVDSPFGRLNMSTSQLLENFKCLLQEVNKGRPKRAGLYITKCFFTSPPSTERLRVDPFEFVPRELAAPEEKTKGKAIQQTIGEDSDDENDNEIKSTA